MHNTLKLFFWDSENDNQIASDEAQEVTFNEAIEHMEMLSDTDGSFLGIILPDETTVQFMYAENHELILDIPVKEKKSSYTKTVMMEECMEIIKDLFNGSSPSAIEGIEVISW